MNFTIDKQILFKAVNKVQRAADRRSSLHILSGILIKAENNYITLTATDLSLTIQHIIQDVDVKETGCVVISAKFFNDLLKKLSGEIKLETVDDKLNLSCGELSASINTLDTTDFPEIPVISRTKELCLPTKELKNSLRKTIHFTSPDDIRPVFTGILFKTDDRSINFVATDTYRLAIFNYPIDKPIEINAIIPSKAAKAISSIFEDEITKMRFSNEFAVFECGKIRVITKLIEGQFPNYKAVIPSNPTAKFSVMKMLLKGAIDRANLFCNKNYRIIKICGDQNLVVSGSSNLFGEVKDTIRAFHEGESIEIAFNSEFLLQAINATSEEILNFNYFGSSGPIVICEDGYTQLTLPVRV